METSAEQNQPWQTHAQTTCLAQEKVLLIPNSMTYDELKQRLLTEIEYTERLRHQLKRCRRGICGQIDVTKLPEAISHDGGLLKNDKAKNMVDADVQTDNINVDELQQLGHQSDNLLSKKMVDADVQTDNASSIETQQPYQQQHTLYQQQPDYLLSNAMKTKKMANADVQTDNASSIETQQPYQQQHTLYQQQPDYLLSNAMKTKKMANADVQTDNTSSIETQQPYQQQHTLYQQQPEYLLSNAMKTKKMANADVQTDNASSIETQQPYQQQHTLYQQQPEYLLSNAMKTKKMANADVQTDNASSIETQQPYQQQHTLYQQQPDYLLSNAMKTKKMANADVQTGNAYSIEKKQPWQQPHRMHQQLPDNSQSKLQQLQLLQQEQQQQFWQPQLQKYANAATQPTPTLLSHAEDHQQAPSPLQQQQAQRSVHFSTHVAPHAPATPVLLESSQLTSLGNDTANMVQFFTPHQTARSRFESIEGAAQQIDFRSVMIDSPNQSPVAPPSAIVASTTSELELALAQLRHELEQSLHLNVKQSAMQHQTSANGSAVQSGNLVPLSAALHDLQHELPTPWRAESRQLETRQHIAVSGAVHACRPGHEAARSKDTENKSYLPPSKLPVLAKHREPLRAHVNGFTHNPNRPTRLTSIR